MGRNQNKKNNTNLCKISECIQIIANATKKLNTIQKNLIDEYNIHNNLLRSIKNDEIYILDWEYSGDKANILRCLRKEIDFIKELKKLATLWMCNYKLQESGQYKITTICTNIVEYALSGEYIGNSLIRECIDHILNYCSRNMIYNKIGISYNTLRSSLVNRIRIFLSNTKTVWENKENKFLGKFEIPDNSLYIHNDNIQYTLDNIQANFTQYSPESSNDDIESSNDNIISTDYNMGIEEKDTNIKDITNKEDSSSSISFGDVFGD